MTSPTETFAVEAIVMTEVPLADPAVQLETHAGVPPAPSVAAVWGVELPMHTEPPKKQLTLPVMTSFVWFAPAPRSVTLLMPDRLIPLVRLNVPAWRLTTPPPAASADVLLAQAESALLIVAAEPVYAA